MFLYFATRPVGRAGRQLIRSYVKGLIQNTILFLPIISTRCHIYRAFGMPYHPLEISIYCFQRAENSYNYHTFTVISPNRNKRYWAVRTLDRWLLVRFPDISSHRIHWVFKECRAPQTGLCSRRKYYSKLYEWPGNTRRLSFAHEPVYEGFQYAQESSSIWHAERVDTLEYKTFSLSAAGGHVFSVPGNIPVFHVSDAIIPPYKTVYTKGIPLGIASFPI